MDEQLYHAPCGYLVFDQDGQVLEVNEKMLMMLGYKEGEVIDQSFQRLLTLPSRLYYQSYVLPQINLNDSVSEVYIALKAAKEDLPVVMTAKVRDDNGVLFVDCVFISVKLRDGYVKKLIEEKKMIE
ncbi:PAS domain-containing protein [Paenisporosarcina quisquiliarum]|uniref:PAS domain-containing protein n=1 Tax=Paenisporosarcina quisquiliarum TaxID=365346 RepID=UPI003736FDAC